MPSRLSMRRERRGTPRPAKRCSAPWESGGSPQGDVPRAILAFTVAGYAETIRFMLDMYATPEDLQSLERLLASPPEAESAAGAARFPFKAV